MKLTVGNVIKISARKRSLYMVTEVRETSRDYLLRRVNRDFVDAGDKGTFRVPFSQMEEILEEVVGNGTPSGSLGVSKRKASEVIAVEGVFERHAVKLLNSLAGEFSPENLTCDGELYGAQLQEKKRVLDRKWKAMELYFGYEIENDIF